MPVCLRCNVDIPFFKAIFAFDQETQRCKQCETQVKQVLLETHTLFQNITKNAYLTPQGLEQVLSYPLSQRVSREEAILFLRVDGIQLLSSILATQKISDIIEHQFFLIQRLLNIPTEDIHPQLRQLALANLTRGKFVIIPHESLHNIRLESDEFCYLVAQAEFCKQLKTDTRFQQGRIVVTNKKLRFLSNDGGTEANWNTVMSVQAQRQQFYSKTFGTIAKDGIFLELTKKSGNGFYTVQDPELTQKIIDTYLRIAKRQLVIQNGNTRHISQEVRSAVWQRDQGRCVQCGDMQYLELDHIIPFSKGGATSINNLQLLCRKCNLTKGDRI
jgi:5-methylcytosine-specific restriction endonuclease McrA